MKRKLLRRQLKWIMANKERHNQLRWTSILGIKVKSQPDEIINCGTQACLAGHLAFAHAPVGTVFGPDYMYRDMDHYYRGKNVSYMGFAAHLAELDHAETEYLFHHSRTRKQMKRFLKAKSAGREAILRELYGASTYERMLESSISRSEWETKNLETFFPELRGDGTTESDRPSGS